jgi:hypothetical protein
VNAAIQFPPVTKNRYAKTNGDPINNHAEIASQATPVRVNRRLNNDIAKINSGVINTVAVQSTGLSIPQATNAEKTTATLLNTARRLPNKAQITNSGASCNTKYRRPNSIGGAHTNTIDSAVASNQID